VTVNGIGWGVTPVTIRYLPEGDKRIRVSKDGYITEEQVVHLAEGHPIRLDIGLHGAP
jgi:PEGA domain